MPVYVDDARNQLGRMIMCHMIADTHAELQAMAQSIRLSPQWLQDEGQRREHYDVSLFLRKRAVEDGAIVITQRELATKLMNRSLPLYYGEVADE